MNTRYHIFLLQPLQIHLPDLKQATNQFHYEIQSLTDNCLLINYKVATVQHMVSSEISKTIVVSLLFL